MIDPRIWGNTPGFGRAPLLPTPQAPAAATAAPRQDILRLLQQATGNDRVMPGDRPVGQLVRDPATMTQAQQIAEMTALGGFPSEGRAMWTRAPSAAVSTMATLAGSGGVGLPAAMMAGAGVEDRQRKLAGALTQGMAEAMERGTQARDQRDLAVRAPGFVDAYERGRQAARAYRPEQEQRGGGDSLSGGRGGGSLGGGSGGDVMSGGRF